MKSAAPAHPPAADAAGRAMAASLARLLDRVRGAREVLPHLAALERGLMEHGSAAIERVPAAWLARISSQLASLPMPADDAALHQLLDGLSARLNAGRIDWEEPSLPGGFDPEKTVVIREISHSEFMAASDEMATTMPLPLVLDESR